MTLYFVIALAGGLVFAAGILVGVVCSRKKIKKLEGKLKQAEARARGVRKSASGGEAPRGEPQPHSQTASTERPVESGEPGKKAPAPIRPEPAEPRGGSREPSPIDRGQWYQKFGQVGTLEASFQYSFPDQMYFKQGTGYLRNAKNQLVPEEKVFTMVNTATGYAMNGLFWVFNVTYRGKEYTFQQILDGKMTTGYVRVAGIPALALVEPAGTDGCYRLVQKGRLKIVDV